ncbi:MAG: hypothetical protein NTX50_16915 [Candidatus Sumerlaeota bacterium]|nr:hypothetical protein [Candidatus Sumerlaeota bacterium]
MPDEKKEATANIIPNHLLPSIAVDQVMLGRRSDGMSLLRMYSTLPEGMVEQARIMIQQSRMKPMIDALCKHSNYYPRPAQARNDEPLPSQKLKVKGRRSMK